MAQEVSIHINGYIYYGPAYEIVTTDFTFLEYVQDGFLNNSYNNKGITVLAYVATCYTSIMRNVTLSEPLCHW